MDKAKGVEVMKEVLKKLSKGKTISFQLGEAFHIALNGSGIDFSHNHYNELEVLRNDYDNQIKYETPTVDNNGELNTAYESLFHLRDRLRSLAESIIETNREGEDENNLK